jgi:hypothetical protein
MINQGANNSLAKLTDTKVELIHALKRIKKVKNETIGNLFGIKKSTVAGILRGKAWKHVQPPTPEKAIELVAAFETLEDPEKEYIDFRRMPLDSGRESMKEFLKSKKSKVTLWLMKPFSDNQGINNFRYSMGVKK